MYTNSNQNQYLLRRFAEQVFPQILRPPQDTLGHRHVATGCSIYMPFPFDSSEFSTAVQGVDLTTPTIVPPGGDLPPGTSGSSRSASSSSSPSDSGSTSGSESSSASDTSSSGSSGDGGGGGSDSGSGSGSASDGGSGSGGGGDPVYSCSDPGPSSCCAAIAVIGTIIFQTFCPPATEEIPFCCEAVETCPQIDSPCPILLDVFCCYANGELRTIQDMPDSSCLCECCVDELGILYCPCFA